MKNEFCHWLQNNTQYGSRVQSDIVSRLKRANSFIPLPNTSDMYYIFQLQQNDLYKALSTSVKSQIKKAVVIYFQFLDDQ